MKSFKHYMNAQLLEVEEHKYYLSQHFGYDVGEEVALIDWVASGHAERFARDYTGHEEEIEIYFSRHETIDKETIHILLGDRLE